MPVTKQTGITPSEQYLGQLCRKSFLSLWSYQNVFTDRGKNEKNRQGKELCDLLVIFENDIIIFSDKSCEMPDTGDIWLDWSRWYKRAIEKSASQVFGAERWLKEHPNRLFIDPHCQQPFPLPIPPEDHRTIHRVVVALGSKERAERHFGEGSRGSLTLASWLRGQDHTTRGEGSSPFSVGHVDTDKGFVHVFNDVTLDIVMSELDTISDFIQYLTAKTDFLESCNLVQCAGEEEFLGFYLQNLDDEGNFLPAAVEKAVSEGRTMIHIAEGMWDEYLLSPIAHARRQEKEESRFIDSLVEHLSAHLLSGTLLYGNDDEFSDQETNLRFLASEPRYNRAVISTAIGQKLATTPSNVRSSIIIRSSRLDRLFVFLLWPRTIGQRQKAYRRERHEMMGAYCYIVKYMNPDVRYVVCLSTEPGSTRRRRSEDLVSFDFEGWTDEDDKQAAQLQEELDILTDFSLRPLGEPTVERRGDLKGNRRERRKAKSINRRTPS